MTICQSQVRAQYYALAHEGLQAQTQAEAEDRQGIIPGYIATGQNFNVRVNMQKKTDLGC